MDKMALKSYRLLKSNKKRKKKKRRVLGGFIEVGLGLAALGVGLAAFQGVTN